MKNKKLLLIIIVALIALLIGVAFYFFKAEEQKDISDISNIIETDITSWLESNEFEETYKHIVFASNVEDSETNNTLNAIKTKWNNEIEYNILKSDIVFNKEQTTIDGINTNGKSAIVPVKFKNISFVDYYFNWSLAYNEAMLDSFIPLELDSTLSADELLDNANKKIEEAFITSFDNLENNSEIVITYLLVKEENGSWNIAQTSTSANNLNVEELILNNNLSTDPVYMSIYLNNYDKIFDEEYIEEVSTALDEHLKEYAFDKYNFNLDDYINGLEKQTEIIENELDLAKQED